MMNKSIKQFFLVLSLLFACNANAVFLSLSPSSTFAETGDSVTLDLMIGGLGAGGPESVGDFDLDLHYDPGTISVDSFSLTSLLGDVFLGEALDLSLGDDGFGTLSLSLVSFLFDFELDALQPDSFSLAEIMFSVDALPLDSSTEVAIGPIFGLGNAFGDPLLIDGTSNAIIHNRSQISEPPMLWLMLPLVLILLRRVR
ncbi:hypothetical protein [Vibrio sp. HN007]|uniref:hypothetical protein n=1 Tax=Vibrio iocasae TaxID=3098914 RepID=UPI0035D42F8A